MYSTTLLMKPAFLSTSLTSVNFCLTSNWWQKPGIILNCFPFLLFHSRIKCNHSTCWWLKTAQCINWTFLSCKYRYQTVLCSLSVNQWWRSYLSDLKIPCNIYSLWIYLKLSIPRIRKSSIRGEINMLNVCTISVLRGPSMLHAVLRVCGWELSCVSLVVLFNYKGRW